MSREMNLGMRSSKKLPFAKETPTEALLITSEGATLAENLGDIQERVDLASEIYRDFILINTNQRKIGSIF